MPLVGRNFRRRLPGVRAALPGEVKAIIAVGIERQLKSCAARLLLLHHPLIRIIRAGLNPGKDRLRRARRQPCSRIIDTVIVPIKRRDLSRTSAAGRYFGARRGRTSAEAAGCS